MRPGSIRAALQREWVRVALFALASLALFQAVFMRGLASGEAGIGLDGHLNLRDPACMLYPGWNDCRPDGLFSAERGEALRAFAAYRAIPFGAPPSHRIAVWTSVGAWLGLLGVLSVAAAAALRRRWAA